MSLIRPASLRQLDLGLAILRLAAGTIFVAHGAQKLFVFGIDGVAGAFGQIGIPLAPFTGPAVAVVEFFAGLALIAGLLTRLAGLGLVVTMLGALVFVHAANGLFLPNGYEFVLALLGLVVTLTITGAGRYSLDALVAARREPAVAEASRLRQAA